MPRDLNRRLLGASAVAALAAASWTSSAVAAGGPDIASSTGVVPGQQMYGNTSAGRYDVCSSADYWHIDLSAGDRARIDWTTLADSDGQPYVRELFVYPPGTTDFSINNVDPVESYDVGDNDRAESIFVAGSAGSYPLVFDMDNCDESGGGPFDFTVTVTHAVAVTMGSVKSLRHRHGRLTLGAHRPDGQPISDPGLHLSVVASWRGRRAHPVATASPVNGTARVAVHLPRSAAGKKVTVRTVASGAGYRTARTRSRSVRVRRG